ncbi:MAG TPA: hypothetical protein DIT05_09800 [Morganella sp. (in: Bacteria)]|nr:hypothetical protein [Morganella sp. (in: enterobacteria)]
MRVISRKKEIMALSEESSRESVTTEIGLLHFEVSEVAYLLHGIELFDESFIKSVSRKLKDMVPEGYLRKYLSL